MPKLYQFPQVKCSENENFRTRSIAGCRYEARVPEFRPHVSMRSKDVTMKPPIQPQAKPQPPLTSHMKESYDDGKSHLGPSNVKPLKAVNKLTSEQYDKGLEQVWRSTRPCAPHKVLDPDGPNHS